MLRTIAAFDRIGEENAFAVLADAIESGNGAKHELTPRSGTVGAIATVPDSYIV